MLKARLTPTPLLAAADRPEITISDSRQPVRFPNLRVAARLLWWCITISGLWARRRDSSAEYGRRFRVLLERLGGLWVKFGQLLSLRIDIFSAEFCSELSQLQVNAVGFAPAEALRILEEEFGGPPHLFFAELEKQPFAAASMGQVHIGRLRGSGVRVAVKVQRPDLPWIFAQQIRLIRWIATLLQLARFRPHMGWQDMIWELNQIMLEEMDCRYEGSATRRMRQNLKAHNVYAPKVFYATRRVLVTEFIDGVLMADYIRALTVDPEKVTAWEAENEVDPKVVARRLSLSLMRQLFGDNLYHGDLHPGNIMLLRDNRIALIDFGGCSFTERELLERLRTSTRALCTRDYAEWADSSLIACGPLPQVDVDEIREEFLQAGHEWAERVGISSVPYHQKSVAALYNLMAKILYSHRCAMGWPLLRVRRGMETLDSSLVHLYSNMDYFKISNQFFREDDNRRLNQANLEGAQPLLATGRNALEMIERLDEFALFQAGIVRQHARVFQTATNKTVDVLASATLVAFIVLLGGLLIFTALVGQRQPLGLAALEPQTILNLFRAVPRLDWQIWGLVSAAIAYSCGILLQLRSRLYRRGLSSASRVAPA